MLELISQIAILSALTGIVFFSRGAWAWAVGFGFYMSLMWHTLAVLVLVLSACVIIVECLELLNRRRIYNFGPVVGNPLS